MEQFKEKYAKSIVGILSGYDRIVLRGSITSLSIQNGMAIFLNMIGVLLKDFGEYVEGVSKRLKEASLNQAVIDGRPILYLPSNQVAKEPIAREIMDKDGIENGLICVLTCVEPCYSFGVHPDRESKKLVVKPSKRKCLHLYHYWIDEVFGFMSARIQTWFPFTIQICLNGREWLAKQLDEIYYSYKKVKNSFTYLSDFELAQKLMNKQLKFDWLPVLERISHQLNPLHKDIFQNYNANYYWSVLQSEWATDITFDSPDFLPSIYPQLVQGAISSFSSKDVIRYLGDKNLSTNFKGKVLTDYKQRTEGVRVKHWAKSNSVKIYDKSGSILRVETTINDPKEFKEFRPKMNDLKGEPQWLQMRKSIASFPRRADVSNAINNRYLNALATLNTNKKVKEIVDKICQPVVWKENRFRAINPWNNEDFSLLRVINQGEFVINGFRNRDILNSIYPSIEPENKKRFSARITRKLRMLRAHGIISKIKKSNRYIVTSKGREVLNTILAYENISLDEIRKAS